MKKLLAFAFFGIFLSALSVVSISAYADTATQPGCAPEVMTAQQNHVAALQVRDKAVSRQIVHQNDTSLGLTCYDQSLALTSRLGQMFSDTYHKDDFPTANTAVFGAVYDPASGGGKPLAQDISSAVSPILSNHANNFTEAVGGAVGASALNGMQLDTSIPLTDFLSTIIGPLIAQINGAIATVDSYMNTLFGILDTLGSVIPVGIPGVVIVIKNAWKTIKTTLTQAVQQVQDLIRTAMKNLTDGLQTELGNSNDATNNDPSTGPCSTIQQLYNPGVAKDAAGFRSVVGGGLEQGTPYLTFAELVNRAPNTQFDGPDFMQEILNDSNSTVLQTALQDISGTGILTGAQSFLTTVNKVPAADAMPTFSAGATMATIRSKM